MPNQGPAGPSRFAGGGWRRIGFVAGKLPLRRSAALALVLAIAVTAGGAMAAMVGAGRAHHALPDFIAWSHPEDAAVAADPSRPPAEQDAALRKAIALPAVTASQRVAVVVSTVRSSNGTGQEALLGYVGIDPLGASGIRRMRVLRGRLPASDRPDEVVVNEDLSRRLHVGIGDRLTANLFPPDQIDVLGNGRIPAHRKAVVTFHIVGLTRQAGDLEVDPEAQKGTLYELNGSLLFATPAFWQAWGHRVAGYGIEARVKLVRHDVRAFTAEVHQAGLRLQVQPNTDIVLDLPSLKRSTHVESGALWAMGALIALVATVLIGPALRRTVAISSADREALVALGLTRRDLVGVELRRAAPIAIAGAVGSIPVAVALSPWAAFGVSRRALLDPGVVFHPRFLVAGAAALLVATMGLMALTAALARPHRSVDLADIGSARRGGRRYLARLAGMGAPPALLAGVRMAFPSNGRDGSAIRSAVFTVATGVALVVAALTFSASMTHLVRTPRLRGWTWDVEAGNFSETASAKHAGKALAADRDVADFTGSNTETADGPAGTLNLVGLGDVGMAQLPALSGRLPSRAGEIALTSRTLDALHRHVGDRVTLRINNAATFRIVGTTLGPGAIAPEDQLGEGGIVTLQDLSRLIPGGSDVEGYLVRFRAGVDQEQARARLGPEFHSSLLGPFATTEVETIRRTEPLPLLFATLVAILALGTLIHAVAMALRRNRREVALLKALGFSRGQIQSTILVQAAVLVGVAGLFGLPIGLVVGRWSWRLAAQTIGVVVVPVVPLLTVAAVVAAALGTALAVGAIAARTAERVPAAATLRTE